MQFKPRKRRQPPAVIIVSLIDVLMVVLIFLMVTTTFKQQPAVKILLPQSKQAQEGSAQDSLLVTIAPHPPYLYLGNRQVTADQLRAQLQTALRDNPRAVVSVNSDGQAPIQELVSVLDVVREVKIPVQLLTRPAAKP